MLREFKILIKAVFARLKYLLIICVEMKSLFAFGIRFFLLKTGIYLLNVVSKFVHAQAALF